MKPKIGISHRLLQAFLIQAALISVVALLGVYAARYVIGDVLIQRALDDEANHYWMLYEKDKNTARPNTYNLQGYLQSYDEIPEAFSNLKIGLHKLKKEETDFYILHISENKGEKLYLEFDGEQVSKLALFFGIFPLAGFLIIIYLSGWFTYRFLSEAVSPIIKLARTLENLDPQSEEFSEKLKHTLPDNIDQEVAVLSKALSGLSERIEAFVIRERNFTRDASHELRSPITVIKIASDILLDDTGLNDNQRKQINRIKNNASDMEELIEALLILARESDNKLSSESICINDIVKEEIERTIDLLTDKPVEVEFNEQNKIIVSGSDKVLSVMIGNLIRNAFSYTDEGNVVINLLDTSLVIEDSGIGMPEKDIENMFKPFQRGQSKKRGGYGVGLTIVKMLSDRFYWPIKVESQLEKGTKVMVSFPDASIE